MKIKDAAAILADLAKTHGDCNLSVFADGAHHTTKLCFYAIQPMSELQRTQHVTARKWERETFSEPVPKHSGPRRDPNSEVYDPLLAKEMLTSLKKDPSNV